MIAVLHVNDSGQTWEDYEPDAHKALRVWSKMILKFFIPENFFYLDRYVYTPYCSLGILKALYMS